jgi:hypothetical protein
MTDYRKPLREIVLQVDNAKNSLALLVLDLDANNRDTTSLDEALEALDDVIDILEDYAEEEI